MKKIGLVLSLWLAPPLWVHAQCSYVRTAYSVDSCKPAPKEQASGYDATTSTPTPALPGLEEPETGPLDEVTCDCAYVLDGSNPLCDSDREQPFTQTYPQDPSTPNCKHAKSLCAAICPKVIH